MNKIKNKIYTLLIIIVFVGSIVSWYYVIYLPYIAKGCLEQARNLANAFSFFNSIAFIFMAFTLFNQVKENGRLQKQYEDSKEEKRKEELTKYSNCLVTISNELAFYRGKFQQLLKEVKDAIEAVNTGKLLVLPTYKLYPDFLEKQKIELSKFHYNYELITDIGDCHFELCHILERLNLYVDKMSSIHDPLSNRTLILMNADGFKGLLDQNIGTYKNVISKIQTEIENTNNKITIDKKL